MSVLCVFMMNAIIFLCRMHSILCRVIHYNWLSFFTKCLMVLGYHTPAIMQTSAFLHMFVIML